MQFTVVLLFFFLSLASICPSSTVVADSLLETLKTSAGAGKFAAAVEDDPVLKAIFLDPSIKTVFALSDQAMDNFMNNPPDIPRRFRIRAPSPDDQSALSMSASSTQTDINKERTVPGSVFNTSKSANTPSKQAAVVSNPSNSETKLKRGYWGPVPAPSFNNLSISVYNPPESIGASHPPLYSPSKSHTISYASPESSSYAAPPPPKSLSILYPPNVETTTSCFTPSLPENISYPAPLPPSPPKSPSTLNAETTTSPFASSPLSPPPYTPPASTVITPLPPAPTETLLPIQIFSGLGRSVNIIRQDIPFDGGLIHIIDGIFTLPQILSKTSTLTGNTAFASAMQSTNLTYSLDNTSGITAFIPNNAAVATSGGSITTQTVKNHIISGFVGHLPDLKEGATLTTMAGQGVSIKVVNGVYYVGGARILHSNLILDNGVGHVIDSVLTLPTVPFKGTGSVTVPGGRLTAIVATCAALLLASVF
ncbi:MAG: hypothetical protein M1839_006239 [Geoglossum umbratile]|nr:MAG: hypothetical protein M1839_006239 [Geoglossum umbratile]